MPEAKSRLFIVDQTLKDYQGHHFEYDAAIAEAAQAAGLNPVIVANKAYETLEAETATVVPWYRASWYDASADSRHARSFWSETLDLLQEVVSGYQGTVILVSHDRDFLDRTVTSTIAPANPDLPDGHWIEYAGGYTDMLMQRKSLADEKKKAERDKAPGRADGASGRGDGMPQKGKLSFKQKFAIDNLPKQMQAKEAEIAAFEKTMADPKFFARDPDGFAKLASQLEAARSAVHAMEEQWLELEMLREEIEG
mgnify:CR=1 FL=1